LFLDSRMIYSTACFARPEDDLDTAQLQKLEKICRTLQLQAGERFLDIGCGWGGLIVHAAQNFGVRALGITLSEKQAQMARERIRAAGLDDRCRVEICDYRDLKETAGFDKIASDGMVEHVGAKQLPEYFGRVWRLLRPGGKFLNCGISRPVNEPAHRAASFTDAYVFPDGELEPIHEMLRAAEMTGFEVCSTENLREHYGLTLRHWVHRLESHADEARRVTDDVTYRVWRLYMAGSAERFMAGKLHVFQTLLVKTAEEQNR
jgi:cyclopropane-fatty-acyl-phospholipid synthase